MENIREMKISTTKMGTFLNLDLMDKVNLWLIKKKINCLSTLLVVTDIFDLSEVSSKEHGYIIAYIIKNKEEFENIFTFKEYF